MMRTEDWTRDEKGMTNTVVVQVFDEPTVHVSDMYMEELGMSASEFPEVVHPHHEAFTRAVPYATLVARLEYLGWTHARTS